MHKTSLKISFNLQRQPLDRASISSMNHPKESRYKS